MFLNIGRLYGHHLAAIDGDFGHVKDFYLDDRTWIVRYVVADTGSWLTGRKVLIHPQSFLTLKHTGKRLQVNLTKKQIEDSPLIGTDEPVSRQFEETYFEHYLHFRPYYRENDDAWHQKSIPMTDMPRIPQAELGSPHLRSTQAMLGYRLNGIDGEIGHLEDFLMDDSDWTIRQLVITIGGKHSGHHVQVPTSQVVGIDFANAMVSVSLTRIAVEQNPLYQLQAASTGG